MLLVVAFLVSLHHELELTLQFAWCDEFIHVSSAKLVVPAIFINTEFSMKDT